MNCSYTLTESDVVKAMQLHCRGARSTLIVLVLVASVVLLLGILSGYKAVGIGAAVGGLIGYFCVLYLVTPFNAKRQYKQNRALRAEIYMHLSSQELGFKAETGESKLLWSDIHKWKYAKGVYLLYVTSNMFHMVPSRALANENELTHLLSQHVGSNKA